MFFRKKNRTHEPLPPWMKWAVIAFLGLALLGNLHNKNTPGAPETIPETLQTAAQNLNPHKLLPIDAYKNTIFPHYDAGLRIKDIAPGTGTSAVCGQQVKIAYETFPAVETKPADKPAKESLTFRIGDGAVMPEFEQGVTGMKKGGKRDIFSANKRFAVELLEAIPAMQDANTSPYRIAIVKPGNGAVALCGMPGKFQVTVWDIGGKKLFSTKDGGKALTFTPGKSEVFLGLEQGVIGMKQGEMRTLVIPPVFQKTMNDNPSAVDFHLPKEQTVLVDVVNSD